MGDACFSGGSTVPKFPLACGAVVPVKGEDVLGEEDEEMPPVMIPLVWTVVLVFTPLEILMVTLFRAGMINGEEPGGDRRVRELSSTPFVVATVMVLVDVVVNVVHLRDPSSATPFPPPSCTASCTEGEDCRKPKIGVEPVVVRGPDETAPPAREQQKELFLGSLVECKRIEDDDDVEE